jgi:hypothetical protein
MGAIKKKFHEELDDLIQLISFFEIEYELNKHKVAKKNTNDAKLLRKLADVLLPFKNRKKQFNYNSIIISLYGFFEKYIENSVTEYLEAISKIITNYNDLPQAISKNNFEQSLILLNKLDTAKYRDYLRKEDVISNLHKCFDTSNNYLLNLDAFTIHGANFKASVIQTIFQQVGIDTIDTKILGNDKFKKYIIDYYKKKQGDNIKADEAFYLLNDLAQLRNDVAHGVTSDIIANPILLDYVLFFKFYSEALSTVINNELLRYECKYSARELGKLTGYFESGKKICFNTKNVPLKVGDTLIGLTESLVVETTIESIHINEVEADSADDSEDFEVGVKITLPVKKKTRIFLK